MTLDYGYTRNGSFDGKTFKVYLLTSIDGFVDSADIAGSEELTVGANTGTPVYPIIGGSIDLSGAQFQNITTTTEFRFYLSDDTGGSDYIHRIDNVVLNGTVTAVPEPSSLALLGAGAALLAAALRRRKRA